MWQKKEGKVASDIIKVTDKRVRRNRPIITINIYRTTSSFLVNGTQVQKFIQKVIPMIQSWTQYNQTAIEIMDKKIEQVLREISVQYVEGAEEYCQAVAGKNRTEDTSEDSLKLDFKIQKIEKTDYIKLESDDEIDTQENDQKLKEEGKNHYTNGRQTKKEEKGEKETTRNNREEDKGKKGVMEEDITQKHSIGKPIDGELEREMRNINEERIEKQQENVVSNDNDKTNKENVNTKVREEDATQR